MKFLSVFSRIERRTVRAAAIAVGAAVLFMSLSVVGYQMLSAKPAAELYIDPVNEIDPTNPGEKTVWQIGVFDNDYAELAIAGKSESFKGLYDTPITFRAGKDDPKVMWPYVHPGPSDWSWAGAGPNPHYISARGIVDVDSRFTEGPHPVTIVFDLDEKPMGTFNLKIAFVGTQPASGAAPNYEAQINDAKFSQQLPNGKDGAVLSDASAGTGYTLDIQFPATILKMGENRIRLNILSGSWAVYDALSLSCDAGKALPAADIKGLILTPTEFVTAGKNNKRIVRAEGNITQPLTPGYVSFDSGSGKVHVPFISDGKGLVDVELPVDDSKKALELKAVMHSGAASREAKVTVEPSRPWRLYVHAAIHSDNGYTDPSDVVRDIVNNNVLTALDAMKVYPDFQFHSEVSMYEDYLFETMTDAQKADYISMTKAGRLTMSARFAVPLDNLCSHESFIRDLYPHAAKAAEYDFPNIIASSADTPTNAMTLPSILAGSGVKYFVAGLNRPKDALALNICDRPFYWQGPDGAKVLSWLSSANGSGSTDFIGYGGALYLSLYSNIEDAKPRIEKYMSQFLRKDYLSDAVLVYGLDVDERPLNPSMMSVIEEWNKKYASPKIILTSGPSFFEDIEKDWRGTIPTFSGDPGAGWENGAGASAVESAMVRIGSETLVSSEKLNVINALNNQPTLSTKDFAAAWRNVSFWNEHCFGAEESVDKPKSPFTLKLWGIKSGYATTLNQQSNDYLDKSLDALAKSLKVNTPSFVVYNPTNQPVTSWVNAKTSTGKSVTFRADDVPALGYKIIPESDIYQNTSSSATFDANTLTLSNKYYSIKVDGTTGGVSSIYDKALNCELVKKDAPYQANQYLYHMSKDSAEWPPKDLTHANGREPVSVTVEDRPGGKAIVIKTKAYNTPELVSVILLHDDIKRIDFNNTLNKTETMNKEHGFFAFPFNVNNHKFSVDIPNGVLQPDKDGLPNARFDWYGPQDFVVVEGKNNDKDIAITWTAIDSPLATLSAPSFNLGAQPVNLDNSFVFGYVFNNQWHTNYKASQGGVMTFRFSLTSSEKYNPSESAQFGQSVRQPLAAASVIPNNTITGSLSPASYSFCKITSSDVKIQSIKQAESGNGIIIRLRNMTDAKSVTLTVNSGKFKEAWLCNLVEVKQSKTEIKDNTFTVNMNAYGLATVMLIPQ